MVAAALWGLLGASSLLAGAIAGLYARLPERAIGLIMGFGAGALISAVSFELTQEAFNLAGADAVALGLGAGALSFYAADTLIDRRGGERRKRMPGERRRPGSGAALMAGAVIDGIPESVVIGISLLEGPVSAAVVAAVFLSNLPEAIAGAAGMKQAGHAPSRIILAWGGVVIASAVASGVGYGVLENASDDVVATLQAFAAGGVLTMLADEMIPAGYEHGGRAAGLLTVLGFALAYLLSTI